MIDLHCHLDLYPDPKKVAQECQARRIYALSVTTTPSAFPGTSRLVSPSGRIRTALGLHPELAAERKHELPLFERLLPETDYVGEIGLDGSRDHRATLETQTSVFREILRLCALRGGRVLTIHSRSTTGQVLDVLASVPGAGIPILHWYLGTARQIARAATMSAWFSVGPSMLRSERGRAAAAQMPRDRILPESDGPFGEIDGRPAYPWEAWQVVTYLADLWRCPPREVEAQLVANFRALVGEEHSA